MYTTDLGFYPLMGIAVGACCYAAYRFCLRLKCMARQAQLFIGVALLAILLSTFVRPVRWQAQNRAAYSLNALTPSPLAPATADYARQNPAPTITDEPVKAAAAEAPVAQAPAMKSLVLPTVPALLGWLYAAGLAATLLWLLVRLGMLWHFLRRQKLVAQGQNGVDVYEMKGDVQPFSFGRYVFLPAQLSGDMRRYVLLHEFSHIRHRHFLWLCLAELLVCLVWFNPFAWLLSYELRLQQELEVDADVIDGGVDRQQYQLALLTMSTADRRWRPTRLSFLGQPLKLRLLFMNTPIGSSQARVRLLAASVLLAVVLSGLMVAACQTREQPSRHPLQGCWRLESFHDDNSRYEIVAPHLQYKWFGDYGELVFNSAHYNNGANNPGFQMNGMDQHYKGDTLLDYRGQQLKYELTADDKLTWHWLHRTANGSIERTELWQRAEPDPALVGLFRAMSMAGQRPSPTHRLNGVWQLDSIGMKDQPATKYDSGSNMKTFLLINDSLYMHFEYHDNTGNRFLNFNLMGHCGDFAADGQGLVSMQGFQLEMLPSADDEHLVLMDTLGSILSKDFPGLCFYYRRIPMPDHLQRLFRPALVER